MIYRFSKKMIFALGFICLSFSMAHADDSGSFLSQVARFWQSDVGNDASICSPYISAITQGGEATRLFFQNADGTFVTSSLLQKKNVGPLQIEGADSTQNTPNFQTISVHRENLISAPAGTRSTRKTYTLLNDYRRTWGSTGLIYIGSINYPEDVHLTIASNSGMNCKYHQKDPFQLTPAKALMITDGRSVGSCDLLASSEGVSCDMGPFKIVNQPGGDVLRYADQKGEEAWHVSVNNGVYVFKSANKKYNDMTFNTTADERSYEQRIYPVNWFASILGAYRGGSTLLLTYKIQ